MKHFTLKLKCKNCGDIICSTRGGSWVACGCFENVEGNKGIYMDRCRWNPEIYRVGNPNGAEEVEESK